MRRCADVGSLDMQPLTDRSPAVTRELDAIFQAFSDLLFVLDEQGRILDYRAGNAALLFAAPELFLGRRIDETLLAGSGNRYQIAVQRALQSRAISSFEFPMTLPDGKHWYDVRLVPSTGGQIIAILRDITKYKQTEEEIQRHLEHLAALRSIDLIISSSLDLKLTLSMLLSHVTTQLNIDAANILLFNSQTHLLEFASGIGFRTDALIHTQLHLGQELAGQAALDRRMIYMPELAVRDTGFVRSPDMEKEAFVCYFGIPLIAKGQIYGVLELFHRSRLNPGQDWLDFMQTLSGQVAIAIENATLFKGLQQSNLELTLAYDSTIEGWSRALDLRDRDTEGHTQRVTEMTLHLARQLGYPDADLIHIRRGAMLHDIGKMAIPDSILLKPGPLSVEEWEIIRQHPRYAYELLTPIPFLNPALDIPHFHHEKWDGSGYPQGLKGDQIPLSALLFAVVDVFDALTSDRPYRPAWPQREALAYIHEQAGRHFAPRAASEFLAMMNGKGSS